jgi:hypothetical protein
MMAVMAAADENPFQYTGSIEPEPLSLWRRSARLAVYVVAGVTACVGILALLAAIRWTLIERREGITEHRLSLVLFLLAGVCAGIASVLVWAGRRICRHEAPSVLPVSRPSREP